MLQPYQFIKLNSKQYNAQHVSSISLMICDTIWFSLVDKWSLFEYSSISISSTSVSIASISSLLSTSITTPPTLSVSAATSSSSPFLVDLILQHKILIKVKTNLYKPSGPLHSCPYRLCHHLYFHFFHTILLSASCWWASSAWNYRIQIWYILQSRIVDNMPLWSRLLGLVQHRLVCHQTIGY